MDAFRDAVDQHLSAGVDDNGNRNCLWCHQLLTLPDGQPVTQPTGSPELTRALTEHAIQVAAAAGWQPNTATLTTEMFLLMWNITGWDREDAITLLAGIEPLLSEHLDDLRLDLDMLR